MNKVKRTQVQEVLQEKMRRLHILERRAATLGINAPPEVITEIEDLQREITTIEERLKEPDSLEQPVVGNTHDDAEPRGISRRLAFLFVLLFLIISVLYVVNRHVSTLQIPYLKTNDEFILDGACREYNNALSKTFVNQNGRIGHSYLYHDDSNLYICIESDSGSKSDRNSAVFLNNLNGVDGYYLLVIFANSRRLSHIKPSKDWVIDQSLDKDWKGAVSVINGKDSFEYIIPLGNFNLGLCKQRFRLGVYHQWPNEIGEAYGWPTIGEGYEGKTDRWQLAHMDDVICPDGPWKAWWNTIMT